MITHSLIIACLESYGMVEKQARLMEKLLPPNWEFILVDDVSQPPIPEHAAYHLLRIVDELRAPGEWTQHEAVNTGVLLAKGEYILKSDIDHVLTPGAIEAADRFTGDMMLFHRKAGLLKDDLTIEPLEHEVYSPVDDIYLMRKSLFLKDGGYPSTRKYGTAGKHFWQYSRRPEAQPPEGALIYVTPDTHETYHSLVRAG